MPPALQRLAPRRAKSQLRVAELLSAARKVFSEQGFQRATTAQIAERAGVSEATVFTYFAGKRELCMAVIKDWYDEISSDLEREVPRLQGIHAQLSYVIRQHLCTLLADGSGMCALVLGEGRSHSQTTQSSKATQTAAVDLAELAAVSTECKRRYTTPLMDCLAHAQAAGEIRQDMPLRLLRDLIYGSMEHVLWDSITAQKRPPIDETAEQLTTLIWSALMPREASLEALTRFQADVKQALRHLEIESSSNNNARTRRTGARPATKAAIKATPATKTKN
jgi:AcrR family transcriptional regulator